MVCESKFFFKNKFTEDVSKGECKILGLMAEFLNTHEVVSKVRECIKITHLFSFFKDEDFANKYRDTILVIVNKPNIKKKFCGSTILSLRPNYDKTKLSITMPYFKSTMNNFEFEYFIITSSLEDIIEKFETVTNHLI